MRKLHFIIMSTSHFTWLSGVGVTVGLCDESYHQREKISLSLSPLKRPNNETAFGEEDKFLMTLSG